MRLHATRLFVVIVLAAAFPVVALAADGYSLFGDAALTSPGNGSPTAVQLSSTGATYSGIDFDVPAGMTFSQLTKLSADYIFTQGSCGGGSPRFQVNLSDGTHSGNVFVYIGQWPSYTGCTQNVWLSTGNLLSPSNFVETTQLPSGVYNDLFSAAQARYASYVVTGIQLVADSGWLAPQTAFVDNVGINDSAFTFEGVATCKNDGWTLFITAPGPFKNQGDCVSYFSRNR